MKSTGGIRRIDGVTRHFGLLAAALAAAAGAASKFSRMLSQRDKRREAHRRKHNNIKARGYGLVSSGTADHNGKGSGYRMNRDSLNISARQQRRFRKAQKHLPLYSQIVTPNSHLRSINFGDALGLGRLPDTVVSRARSKS